MAARVVAPAIVKEQGLETGKIRPVADLIRSARAALDGLPETPVVASPIAEPTSNDMADDASTSDEIKADPASPEIVPDAVPPFRPEWAREAPARRAPVRFVFALDRDGRVTDVSTALADTVGAQGGRLEQRLLHEVIAGFDADAAPTLAGLIAAGETWSALRVEWPVEGLDARVPVELSAMPLVDQEAGVTGFAGFGRCLIGKVEVQDIEAQESDAQDGAADAANASADASAADATAQHVPAAAATSGVSEHDALAHGAFDQESWSTAAFGEMSTAEPDVEPVAMPQGELDFPEASELWSLPGEADDAATEAEATAAPSGAASPELTAAEASTVEPPRKPDQASESDVSVEMDEDAGAQSPPQRRTAPFLLASGRRKNDQPAARNVVSIRDGRPTPVFPGFQRHGLSTSEKNAFREIAKALGARIEGDQDDQTPAGITGLASPGAFAETIQGPSSPDNAGPDADQNNELVLDAGLTGFLDRLPLGLLVLKSDEPLFANRTLLDLTAYPDFKTFVTEGGARAIFRKGITPRQENMPIDPMVLATRDGEMVPVDAQLQLIQWDGSPATLVSIRRAVELEQGKALRTVAQDLRNARAESRELRAILDTATDGVLTLDEQGRVLSLNGAAEALFGLSQNEIVGEHFTGLLTHESHAAATDYLEGMKSGGVRSVLNDGREVEGREKNGGTMPLYMTFGRISDADPARFCVVLRDITAWKRAERDLLEARRAAEQASAKKSDFLAKISHEIRTPMNAIMGFAEVMQEERLGPVGTPKYKEYLADIRTSGQHVVSLVNDLLDLAKIEAGRMELNFQATDLNAIVASAVAIMQPQANAARVLVRTQLATKLPPVVADERSIRQIVLNMLSNATRFTEAGGQVIVSTSLLEGGEAVIRIRDSGIGMSATEIGEALEPFRQVGRKRDKGGTGLGLPLTKALVEANRAGFSLRSRPGEGTMVEITFPATRVLAE
jgi:PAS domain S-box-containing protein